MSASKEVHRLIKNIGTLSGGQASIEDVNWEDGNIGTFKIVLKPNSGYYKGGRFEFQVFLDDQYPNTTDPPKVRCLTDIYHPNIYTCDDTNHSYYDRNICLNLLDKGTWDPAFGLGSIVLGLLFLLSNPNLDSILHDELLFGEDDAEFEDGVKRYMRGEEVQGHYFDAKFFTSSGEELDTDEPCGPSNTSCNIDAMNTMCDVQKITDSKQQTDDSGLDKCDPYIKEQLSDSTMNMRLLDVDGETVLFNNIVHATCGNGKQSKTENEMDTPPMEIVTCDDNSTKEHHLIDNVPPLRRHRSFKKYTSLYHPYKRPRNNNSYSSLLNSANGQCQMFKLKRTFTT